MKKRNLLVLVCLYFGLSVSAQKTVPQTVIAFPSLGLQVTLGSLQSIFNAKDLRIPGNTAPDGHMSVEVIGGQTHTYFGCSDGWANYSCLSVTPSLTAFSSLSGLWLAPSGKFQTVLAGREGVGFESAYAALNSTWTDPSTGTIHGWYQGEHRLAGCAGPFDTEVSIGYAISLDGRHFVKAFSPVLTSAFPSVGCSMQGVDLPEVFDGRDGWLYMAYHLFRDWTHVPGSGVAFARASKAAPGVWWKYSGAGLFNEFGVGGVEAIAIPVGGVNGQIWAPSVTWAPSLNRWLMLHTDFNHEGSIYLRVSDHLLSGWSDPVLLMAPDAQQYRYPSLLQDWLYVSQRPIVPPSGNNGTMGRRSFRVDPLPVQ